MNQRKGMRSTLVIARFAGSGLQLLLTLALTRTTDPVIAAACLLQFTWVQIASAGIAWGYPVTALRDGSVAYVHGARYAVLPRLGWVSINGVVLLITGTAVATVIFDVPLQVAVLVGCSGAGQAMIRIISQTLKAYSREAIAILLEFSFVPASLLAVALILARTSGGITPGQFAMTQALASIIGLVAISIAWRKTAVVPPAAQEQPPRTPPQRHSLHYLGLLQLISIGAAHLPIAAAPLIIAPEYLASFFVAFRVASLVTTIQNALNGYYGPRYARAFARGSRTAVAHLLINSQIVAGAMCAPILIVIPWMSSILTIFGDGYGQAASAYAALAVGQYVNAVTGVVSYVLSLSHRERALVAVNVCSLAALAFGWLTMWALDYTSAVWFAVIFSAYLALKNLINYALARRVIRSMPTPD